MGRSQHIADTLLHRAHSPDAAQELFKEKVLYKPLRLRPTSPDPASQDARKRRRLVRLRQKERLLRRQKPKPLSAREKRMSGIYDVTKDSKKYSIYQPLNQMWQGYMKEVLGIGDISTPAINTANSGSKLASADYHGSSLTVTKSRCATLVGLEGIVIRDTKFTFSIITKKNELKVIPKRYSTFRFEIHEPATSDLVHEHKHGNVIDGPSHPPNSSILSFEIQGSHFEHRAVDRATKKFKHKPMNDL